VKIGRKTNYLDSGGDTVQNPDHVRSTNFRIQFPKKGRGKFLKLITKSIVLTWWQHCSSLGLKYLKFLVCKDAMFSCSFIQITTLTSQFSGFTTI